MKKINDLSSMPKRHSVLADDPYHTLGVRKFSIKNYTAFYIVNDDDRTVHIVRILYNRREWQNFL